jgi:hypothetical protein
MRGAVIVSLLALLLGVDDANAQTRRLHVGVKTGAALSMMTAPDVITENRKDEGAPLLAAEGAAFVSLHPHAVIGFQIELGLATRGAVLPDASTADDRNDERRLRIRYAEVPVLMKLTAPGSQTKSLYMLLGPSLGVRQGAGLHLGAEHTDVSDRVERVAWSALAAIGLQGRHWMVEVRASQGLSHVAIEDDKERVWARGVTVMAGVRF